MNFGYTTDRLYLRILDETSADKILEFYNAGKDVFSKVEPEKSSSFYTLSYQSTLASREFKAFLDGTYMRYYLFDITEPDTIIGTVSFSYFMPMPYYSCIIGYKLLPGCCKKGYATEAVSFLTGCLFKEHKVHRIEAFCLPDNTPSINLLLRTGFEFESVARSAIRLKDGFTDHRRYVLIDYDS